MDKQLSEKFRTFAMKECNGSSELYEYLSLEISEDKEILELASYAKEGQPCPNLLFGAVHFLLLKGTNHTLKEFYPSIVKTPRKVEESFYYFKDFCRQHSAEIIPILKSKLVQTNEVRRCAYLYPTFHYIYDLVEKPLALIEIGTSAGLQLLWDKYSYSYGTNERYGDGTSQVHITSEVRGDHPPYFKKNVPPVAFRIGIDLHPVHLTNDENALWLNALIWPEHSERRDLFEKAAKSLREHPLDLIEGDGVERLLSLADKISRDYAICVFHTHVANQMPSETKKRLLHQVKTIGEDRDIFHLYNNIQDRDLHLDYHLSGNEYTKKIGKTDGHGRWFTWEL